jgi:hypothetical protein
MVVRATKVGDRFHGRVRDGVERLCAWPGCQELGEFRAPKTQRHPHLENQETAQKYDFYCLEHVRAFNAAYDFFKDMTPEEVAAFQRSGIPGWERKSWPFTSKLDSSLWDLAERLDALRADTKDRTHTAQTSFKQPHAKTAISAKDRAALAVLGIAGKVDAQTIRRAYKQMVRRYHPDLNEGDRSCEAQLLRVIEAYAHLSKSTLFS